MAARLHIIGLLSLTSFLLNSQCFRNLDSTYIFPILLLECVVPIRDAIVILKCICSFTRHHTTPPDKATWAKFNYLISWFFLSVSVFLLFIGWWAGSAVQALVSLGSFSLPLFTSFFLFLFCVLCAICSASGSKRAGTILPQVDRLQCQMADSCACTPQPGRYWSW